jgi:hypothetical protein
MPSFAANEWPEDGSNDCSGFVYWCLRFPSRPAESRKVDHPLYRKVNGGWFETTGVYADGRMATGYFSQIKRPAVGALLVYPDYVGKDGRKHDGHIGIITEVADKTKGIAGVGRVVHCSLGGWKRQKDAIQETPPTIWTGHDGSIIVWYEGYTDPMP